MRSGASLVVALLAIALAASKLAHSQCLPHQSSVPEQFVIGGEYVKLPVGAFLLVRKSGEIGAIRIVKIDAVGSEWLGKSTYESYFERSISGPLTAAHVIRQTGEIELHTPPGKDTARIGKWSFLFIKPNVMTMSAITKLQGSEAHGYEFAPTSACTLGEVDFHNKGLRWFRSGSDSPVTLSVADLAR